MPKSKQFVDTSDSDEQKNSASDEEKAKTSTSTKSKSKNTNNKDNPPAKRVKPNDKADGDGVLSTAGPNGERLYEFSGIEKPQVAWFFKGEPIPANNRFQVTETDDGTSTLLIRQAELADQGDYIARATNTVGEVEAKTTLNIVCMKPVINTDLNAAIEVTKGEIMTLKIVVSGAPKPIVIWMRDNRELTFNDRIQVTTPTGDDNTYTLTILNVQSEDQGEYAAKISNIVCPLRGNSINIHPNARWQQNGLTVAGGNGKGNGIHQLSYPLGLYVDDDQTIYVADWSNHRIVEWKSGATSGQVVAGENGQGNADHQLSHPIDVIVDKERDSVIICDGSNRRVVRWPRQNGTRGETIVANIGCVGLTMDENASLYVVDERKHEVKRYRRGESQGTVIAGGNGYGNRLDQLSCPQYVFVDRDHSVYVSDCSNHRVMKWEEGAKQGIIVAGNQGQGNSLTQLSNPYGIIVDQLGTVYVADCWNHRIMRWFKGATKGSVIVGGNGRGEQSNQLNEPVGLSFDPHGNLYVVDCRNRRIQKFNIE
ncbi:unnamed protein product [Rotaria sp. Silwood1]|nr:unnamed protein product [Rotaria sp. Silwood1]